LPLKLNSNVIIIFSHTIINMIWYIDIIFIDKSTFINKKCVNYRILFNKCSFLKINITSKYNIDHLSKNFNQKSRHISLSSIFEAVYSFYCMLMLVEGKALKILVLRFIVILMVRLYVRYDLGLEEVSTKYCVRRSWD